MADVDARRQHCKWLPKQPEHRKSSPLISSSFLVRPSASPSRPFAYSNYFVFGLDHRNITRPWFLDTNCLNRVFVVYFTFQRVLQQGILQKTKLTENGKKIRKHWTSSWVVLTDLFLFLFKESAASKMASSSSSSSSSQTALSGTTNKPELCVDLNGATIEWAAVKSSRKGVFQVSTLLGVQLLLQDEDETNAVLLLFLSHESCIILILILILICPGPLV